ncbi:membrane-associating domain-containing protein [Lasiosphaeria ovina]|uniref:Membrane-associating domain-containing protein n=1 Tax=Lasiosphaeria ovina TaxID=92902 RepID=A0AAE0JUB0_9PEZI|nr:membrane-associating domain-containing protein [Lasiosphaeria ovina]
MLAFVPIAHLVAAVFAVIELGLMAYVVSPWSSAPSVEAFMLFNAVWSLLVLAYVGLTPLYATRVFHRLASLALEWITMIFWFAGSIALAAYWGAPSCHGNTYCGSIEAAIAFGFFLWLLFLFLVVVDTMEALRSRGHATHTTAHGPKPYVGA